MLRGFVREKQLSFTALAKLSATRTNHAAYHLAALVQDGIIRRVARGYALTAPGQRVLVTLGKTQSECPLPVVLVAAEREGKIAFIRRVERPYAGRQSLPGGRLRLDETLTQAAIRLAKEKAGLEVMPFAVGSVAVERLIATDGLAHGFLLVVVRCKVRGVEGARVRWQNPSRLPTTTIPSDAALTQRLARLPLTTFDIPEGRKGF